MRIAACLTTLGFLILLGSVIYGFQYGGGWDEVSQIVNLPWGMVTMVDIYLGFLLFCGWVAFRESSIIATLLWSILILTGGNLATAVYVLIAFWRSGGDWRRFWLGERAREEFR